MAASAVRRCRVGFLASAMSTILISAQLLFVAPGIASATTTAPLPSVLAPSSSWLVAMNFYRAMAGLASVSEDPTLSSGDNDHARYLALNHTVAHAEDPTNPFFTPTGNAAGMASNVAGGSPSSERGWVEEWMAAPFHALGMLRPGLVSSGFGSYNSASFASAALNVLSHATFGPPSHPVEWPGPGTTVPLTAYSGNESPNPLTSCPTVHGSAGLPVYLELPATPNVSAVTFSTSTQSIGTCEFDETNYVNPDPPTQDLARSILGEMHAVVVIPVVPLVPGTAYSVTVTTGNTPISWQFSVSTPAPARGIPFGGPCPAPPQATVRGAAAAVYRSGTWYVRNTLSGGGADACFRLGDPLDVPVWGDWDHDGIVTPGVFRPSNGTWYLSDSVDGSTVDHVVQFASPGDIPIVGRWVNNGPMLLGVFRPSNGTWYLRASLTSGPADNAWPFASPGDVPVTGDWNGDGTDTVGVFRPATGHWYLLNSFDTAVPDLSFGYGSPGDTPVVGDWLNTGSTSVGVVRAGQWFLADHLSTNGAADQVFAFGDATDRPRPR